MDFAAARRKMVASQIRTSEVTDPVVVEAMGAVPRELFLPVASRAFAYIDGDIALGKGRYLSCLRVCCSSPTSKPPIRR